MKGKIVLAGPSIMVPVNLSPPASAPTMRGMRARFDPNGDAGRGRGGRGTPAATPPPMANAEISRRIDDFLVANGALLRINDARRELGQIAAFHNSTYDLTRVVPTVVMRNEDYGRIARILADGTPVELEFNVVNRVYPEGRTAYNTVAEIEGTDKSDEVVMVGGHLDSWHSATGATDNAIGCAVMMEAVRILKAIGVKPRRTIRVALWSGEEQGLLGSQATSEQQFGSFEQPRRSSRNFVGVSQSRQRHRAHPWRGGVRPPRLRPPSCARRWRRSPIWAWSARSRHRSRNIGGSDNTAFNHAGLPGINFRQDPIEYETHTHHTNLDTYERIIEADVKASATVIAATVYRLAMSDEMLPRFKSDEMPPVGAAVGSESRKFQVSRLKSRIMMSRA